MKHSRNINFVHIFEKLLCGRVPVRFFLLQVAFVIGLLQPRLGICVEDDWIYIMSPGDNVWNISEKILGDVGYVPKLMRLNNIETPRQLPPGTGLRIPLDWIQLESTSVQVLTVVGGVEVQSADSAEPQPLLSGATLGVGDQIIVGNNGNVVLRFLDGTEIVLRKDSTATLERVNKIPNTDFADTKLKLESGRTESKVERKGTRFEITTPTASAVVRGTNFRLSVDHQEKEISRVEVLGGQVVVGGGGQRVNVAAGFGTAVEGGNAPLVPVRLLPAPVMQSPAEFSRVLPVDFKWDPVDGAVKYRLQVTAEDAQLPLVDEVVEIPYFSTAEIPDGRYISRVRAIDAVGLEGEEKPYLIELDARPVPPFVVSPLADEIVRTELPHFEWSRPTEGKSYQLQVSQKEDFSVLNLNLAGHTDVQFVPDSWEPGAYYWRVATQTNSETGPFSAAQAFTLRPAPGAPAVESESDENRYVLRWPGGDGGQKYDVQLATDEEFANITIDERLDVPEWQTERPKSLAYFRIRVVDTDGFEGAWSSAQKIDPPPPPWYKFGLIALGFLLIAL